MSGSCKESTVEIVGSVRDPRFRGDDSKNSVITDRFRGDDSKKTESMPTAFAGMTVQKHSHPRASGDLGTNDPIVIEDAL